MHLNLIEYQFAVYLWIAIIKHTNAVFPTKLREKEKLQMHMRQMREITLHMNICDLDINVFIFLLSISLVSLNEEWIYHPLNIHIIGMTLAAHRNFECTIFKINMSIYHCIIVVKRVQCDSGVISWLCSDNISKYEQKQQWLSTMTTPAATTTTITAMWRQRSTFVFDFSSWIIIINVNGRFIELHDMFCFSNCVQRSLAGSEYINNPVTCIAFDMFAMWWYRIDMAKLE